jgi:hypothetical protein
MTQIAGNRSREKLTKLTKLTKPRETAAFGR